MATGGQCHDLLAKTDCITSGWPDWPIILRGIKDFRSFCKALYHKFGCPAILAVSFNRFWNYHTGLATVVGFPQQLHAGKTSHDLHVIVLNTAVWRETSLICRETRYFYPYYSDANETLSKVSTNEIWLEDKMFRMLESLIREWKMYQTFEKCSELAPSNGNSLQGFKNYPWKGSEFTLSKYVNLPSN